MRRAPLALALLVASALPVAPAVAKVPTGPAGSAFYTPPKKLPAGRHGAIIWQRALRGPAVLKGASNELLLYRSTGVSGGPVAESATLALPRRRAPKGGWPVISYAHGTTGVADACAPSRSATGNYADSLVARWVRAGYAVVRADYEGLGTPGEHPYLVGTSEGRSVLDAVRAARRVEPRLSRRVVISGHSQGGHAALWAASLAPRWTPELRVRGTVAFAPASHIAAEAPLLFGLSAPGGGATALGALILRGVDVAHPELGVSALLSPPAAALYPQLDAACLSALAAPTSFGGLAPAQLLRAGVDLAPLTRALAASDPEQLSIRTPVRIEQGDADTTVFKAFTDQLVREYVNRGVKVSYKTYPGVDHVGVIHAGASDAARWIARRLR